MRTVSFRLEAEIPRDKASYALIRDYLTAIRPQLGLEWGRYGKSFGIGFVWTTRRRVTNTRLAAIKKHLIRALIETGLTRPASKPNVYNLEQRITPCYGTTPKATVTMREE